MAVIEGIELFQDSQYAEALNRYLQATIIQRPDGPVFSKLGVLSDPDTLYYVSHVLSILVPSTSDFICALAPSGIPLGVATSHHLQKPLSLYNPQGWEQQGISVNVLPVIPDERKVTLIDAHLRTGRSSSWCKSYLESRHASVVSTLCVPVVFDVCTRVKPSLQVRAFADTSPAAEAISSLSKFHAEDIIPMIADLGGSFWSCPPSLDYDLDEYRAQNPTSKWSEYAKGLGGILRKYPEAKVIPETRDLISKLPHIRSKQLDRGAWDLLHFPDIFTKVCQVVGKAVRLDQYDYLLGVGHLGLVLATAIAFHNQGTFSGRIVAWLGEYNLLPDIPDFDDKRILPVTMRVQFGTYLIDALTEVRRRNGKISEILVGIADFNVKDFAERLRQLSLTRIRQMGMKLVCLS